MLILSRILRGLAMLLAIVTVAATGYYMLMRAEARLPHPQALDGVVLYFKSILSLGLAIASAVATIVLFAVGAVLGRFASKRSPNQRLQLTGDARE